MLRNNLMYMILSVMLCIVFILSELIKLYNMGIVERTGIILVVIFFIIAYCYKENKYIFGIITVMKMLISRTLKYSLDLLTIVFLFMHFTVRFINSYQQYDLKHIIKYLYNYQHVYQCIFSLFFLLLLSATVIFWGEDVWSIVKEAYREIKKEPSQIGFETYSWGAKFVSILCVLIYSVFFWRVLYLLLVDGMFGNFGGI